MVSQTRADVRSMRGVVPTLNGDRDARISVRLDAVRVHGHGEQRSRTSMERPPSRCENAAGAQPHLRRPVRAPALAL